MSTHAKSVPSAHAKSVPSAHATSGHSTPTPSEVATSNHNATNVAEAAETTPATPEQKPRMVFPLALIVVAVLPIAFGVGAVRLKASATSASVVAEDHDDETESETSESEFRPMDRRQGDHQFLERRYEVALRYYKSLGSPDPTRLPAELLYRIALCQEALGLWNEALETLRSVADSAEGPILRSAASFGQARVWFRLNDPSKAESLLRSLEFHADAQNSLPRNMSREIAFLIPLAMAQDVVSSHNPIGKGGSVPFGDLLGWPMETALSWTDEPVQSEDPASESKSTDATTPSNSIRCRLNLRSTNSGNTSPCDRWSVDLVSHGQSISDVVKRLAEQAKWKLNWSDLENSKALERSLDISLEDRPMPYLLTVICAELNANWSLKGNQLTIQRTDENRDRQRQMIAQTLASLESWIPNHRLADHARFAQGQIAQFDGDVLKAATILSSLVGRDSSPLAIRAAFNAATNYYRLGDFERACSQLRYIVDGAPGQSLHTESLILLGRLLMDRGETQDAIFQLRRATESRSQPHEQARAAVFLGMSFLMQNRFQEAAEAVFTQKAHLEEPHVRCAAAFVTAFARWNVVTGEMKEREATFLYRALAALKSDSDWLGQAGQLLLGRAYSELGFDDHMADLYCHMLTIGVTEFVESEMTCSLANYDYANGRIESAKGMWKKLTTGVSNGWRNLARLKLAEVALAEGRAKDALEFCELIQIGERVSRTDLQKVMGRAFEQLGEDKLAAQCYSGQLPTP